MLIFIVRFITRTELHQITQLHINALKTSFDLGLGKFFRTLHVSFHFPDHLLIRNKQVILNFSELLFY